MWAEAGDRSAAHHLARTTGVSVAQATDTLRMAERLADAPATEAALRAGELSVQQAAVITDAAAVRPGCDAQLVEQAGRASLGELRDEAARTKATAVDLEARRRRIHERRGVRHYVDPEGVAHLHWRDNPERLAEVIAGIAPERDRLFKQARKQGPREPFEAYAADALHAVVTGRTEAKAGSRPKMIFRVDLDRILRGYPLDGEICEIAGYGPVAASAVKEMLATKNPILAAVVTKGRDVVTVAHLGRRPNAHQLTALQWLFPECEVEGCHNSAFLEWDHLEPWAETKHTILRKLGAKCSFHHDLKSNQGWDLEVGTGKRPMVPPDHPRHPANVRAASAPANAPPGAAA